MKGNRIITLLTAVAVSATLLNTPLFGSGSLTAYFFYTITALLISCIVFTKQLIYSSTTKINIPYYFFPFASLTIYFLIQSFYLQALNLTNYYWIANCFFLLAIILWNQSLTDAVEKILLFKSIAVITVIESIIVMLQYIGVLKSNSKFFACTGTWQNPNVSAMFIAFGLFAILQIIMNQKEKHNLILKNVCLAGLTITIAAIIVLHCRTAYLIAGLFILPFCFKYIIKNKSVILAASLLLLFGAIILVFNVKTASTNGRINVLNNTVLLIKQKPLLGFGLGMFEKEYNLFIAQNESSSNSHVNMAYNDFLEITVEGGVIALILWISFIVAVIFYSIKNGYSILPVCGFVVMQMSNFGFQAIPAFVVALIYIALGGLTKTDTLKFKNTSILLHNRLTYFTTILTLFLVGTSLFRQLSISNAYHEEKKIAANYSLRVMDVYKKLTSALFTSFVFHEDLGDTYKWFKNYTAAKNEYLMALCFCSKPDILLKAGYCYQYLKQYDSSSNYYTLAENIDPAKLSPKLAMMQLYQEMKDTLSVMAKAKEIIATPLKVETQKGENIKKYAESVLKGIEETNN